MLEAREQWEEACCAAPEELQRGALQAGVDFARASAAPPLPLTPHAEDRASQRRLPLEEIFATVRHGTSQPDGDDTLHYAPSGMVVRTRTGPGTARTVITAWRSWAVYERAAARGVSEQGRGPATAGSVRMAAGEECTIAGVMLRKAGRFLQSSADIVAPHVQVRRVDARLDAGPAGNVLHLNFHVTACSASDERGILKQFLQGNNCHLIRTCARECRGASMNVSLVSLPAL